MENNRLDERRKLRRKPLVGHLEMYSGDLVKRVGNGYVTNISEDGAGVVTAERLRIGQQLRLFFHFPNGWKLDFSGKIIFAEKGVSPTMAYGVKFEPGQGTHILKLM